MRQVMMAGTWNGPWIHRTHDVCLLLLVSTLHIRTSSQSTDHERLHWKNTLVVQYLYALAPLDDAAMQRHSESIKPQMYELVPIKFTETTAASNEKCSHPQF